MGANLMRTLQRFTAALVGVLACLASSMAIAQAPDQTLFGPKQYTRTTGAPNVYTDSFNVGSSVGAPFLLRIVNGEASGANRISSGSIKVNGVQVVGPADFGQNVALIERPLNLAPSDTVEVRLASKPGGYLTVSVLGTTIPPVPTALAPNPLTITAGASGSLTATLAPAPLQPGVLSLASADAGVASVPASVPFAAGQTSVAIPVAGVAAGTTRITAAANGGAASATVNVTPAPPTIASLAPPALTVTQGSSGQLSIAMTAAQAGDTPIALASSNSAVASVPASVSVPAGELSAVVPVAALSAGEADISASLNGSSASSHVTVTPLPPTVVSLLPTLSTVTLGAGTSLTLTISAAQPADVTVPISVTPAGIVSAPDNVVVPAGQLTAAVPLLTLAYGQAGITASLNGTTASAAVNVVPPPVAVTALEPATFTMTVGATSTFTVRINAAQVTNTEVALESSNPAALQVPASVLVAQGATSATFTATGLAVGDSTITASANGTSRSAAVHVAPQPAEIVSLLPNPLPLQQGATGTLTVTINVAQESDTTVALANGDAAIATVPASVVVPAGAISTTIAVNALAAGTTLVTATANGTSAASSVEVTPPPPVVTSIEPPTLSLPKGTPGLLRVTVSRAPNVATAIALASTDPAVASVPPQVNVPAGALYAEFPVTSNSVGQATITASLNGASASSLVTVSPAELVTLTLSPQTPTDYVGEAVPFTATGTMTDGTTEDFTTRVTWSSSSEAVATIAASGVASPLAEGQTTIKAQYTFTAVQTGQPVTVTQSTVLTIKLPTPLVLTAAATSLQETQTTLVTITTSDPPPYGGLVVNLTGSGAGAGTFPPSVAIPEYETSTTFQFTATAAGSFTITASAQNRLPGQVTFSIQPQLSITAVTPSSAEVGATITLDGSGFDPVAANNALVFRGINNTTVAAAPLSATANQITVRVPPLADTGPITLTNGRGTAQSPIFNVSREQDFQLVVNPGTVSAYQGASTIAQAQLSSTGTKSFTGLVTLSVQGLPAGVTASFNPAATLSAFQAGAITFAATGSAAPGTYSVIVQGAFTEGGAPFVRTANVALNVINATGVTGLKGRFVTPEGQGIAGIIVRADTGATPQPQTTTDPAGNFALTGLPSGQTTFRFDATPANPLYPIWPYTVTLASNQVTVMPDWTISPPPSDDKFTPIANATQDQAITDPRFPGLEVRLPAGVTITGWDGVLKTRIAVEKRMPDQLPVSTPPFPMREAYQLYFGTPMGGIPSQPIPVTLPNVSEREPGEQVEIWYFDGSPMGGSGEWKLAGMGTVSADGKTVKSNPGVGIPRFCGVCGLLSLSCPPPPNPPQPPPDGCPACGKPVDLFTGQELMKLDLLTVGGVTPVELSLKYNPVDAFNNRAGTVASLGFGWVSSYDVAFLPFAGPQKRLVLPGARFVNFVDDGSGSYKPFDDPNFDGAVITASNASANEWQLRFKDGRIWRFKPFAGTTGVIRGGPPTFLTEIVDQSGNVLSISRQTNGRMVSIGSLGRFVSMTYGSNGFVSQLRDSADRTVNLTYTATNRLQTVTDPDGKVTSFTYVDDTEIAPDAACSPQPTMGERLKTIRFPGKLAATENFYGSSRRVLRQVGQDGREYRVSYKVAGACVTHVSAPGVRCTANCPDVDSWENFQAGWRIHGGQLTRVTVTEPNGSTYGYAFNAKGTTSSYTNNLGQSTQNKYDGANRLIQRTDPLGRVFKYQYDDAGNVVQKLDPLGRIIDLAYDAKWNRVTNFTRYLADGTPVLMQYAYDPGNGNIARVTNPLGQATTFTYTSQGQRATATVPGGRTTTYAYTASGDLASVTDPLGNERHYATDGAGRVTSETDALGYTTTKAYNGVGSLTAITDPLSQVTRFGYDSAGRIASVTNPLNNIIESYAYDEGDRIKRQADAFDHAALYTYDAAGRLISLTDRKGQITGFGYDAKDRVVSVTYADGLVQTRTYNAVGKIVEIREPGSVLSYSYDNADRVVEAVSDTSSGRTVIAYEYDNLDRVIRRTVGGGDATEYAYDRASRLISIGYRGQTTTFEWDAASRLIGRTMQGGISESRTYDDADRVTRIEYTKADGTVVEAISYTYDANGRRISRSTGGSSVQETPMTAAYDQANRMTSFTLPVAGQTFALGYDDNGSLVSRIDQANPGNATTYRWDARNRLAELSGPGVSSTFTYDVLHRRVEQTANGQTTGFIYDKSQAIAQMSGGAITATLLTTPTADDVLSRHTESGSSRYLTDGLGSVVALADETQAIQSFYAYSPYGETQTLGDDRGNRIQYTARENDLTGLYYYRARYYDPVMKRFLSEDPMGLRGGFNVYGYVRGDPPNRTDPSGMLDFQVCVASCIATMTALCLTPGFPQLLCAACMLLPPPADAACLGACLSTPIINCIGALSSACIIGCGVACYIAND